MPLKGPAELLLLWTLWSSHSKGQVECVWGGGMLPNTKDPDRQRVHAVRGVGINRAGTGRAPRGRNAGAWKLTRAVGSDIGGG